MKRFFFVGLVLIFGFAILGELGRLPIATANGILPNDLLVATVVGVWIFHKTFIERRWPRTAIWLPFLTFVALATVSLISGSRELSGRETVVSGLYLVRFIEYFMLTFVVLDLCEDRGYRERIGRLVIGSALALAILGFLQLIFFPNFEELGLHEVGWDPHIDRLLSTWFDPNFLGGLLAFVLSLLVGRLLEKPGKRLSRRSRLVLAGIGLILLIALFMTYSRSAYLTFVAAAGVVGLLRSRKLIVIGFLAIVLLLSVSDRAQERVSDMVYSAQSLISQDSAELPDATARLRIESWQNAVTIIEDHFWLGVGYNAYSYRQADYGFVKSLEAHHATGADSTLLTVFATTGLLGFAAYLWLLGTMAWQSFWRRTDGFSVGFLGGLAGLLIHSFFVNSLLFTPLLIFFYTGLGLSLSGRPSH